MPASGTMLVREAVAPQWTPFALPGPAQDGLLRRRGDGRVRLLHHGDEPVVIAVAARAGRVHFAARARTAAAARHGIARMRFALGVDDDLAPFHERFAADPVIGRTVRAAPGLRTMRRPEPWEALYIAVTEQQIARERAAEIQRALIRALGRRDPRTGLRDAPAAAAVAAAAPALLVSLGLASGRALALRRVAAELESGRAPLGAPEVATGGATARGAGPGDPDHRRLLAIPGIGTWTIECTALFGQGRLDVVPAGDLGLRRLVGRLGTGRPRAVADEDEVRGFFARYDGWAGLAGEYLLRAHATGRLSRYPRAPRRAGTRWSAGPPTAAA